MAKVPRLPHVCVPAKTSDPTRIPSMPHVRVSPMMRISLGSTSGYGCLRQTPWIQPGSCSTNATPDTRLCIGQGCGSHKNPVNATGLCVAHDADPARTPLRLRPLASNTVDSTRILKQNCHTCHTLVSCPRCGSHSDPGAKVPRLPHVASQYCYTATCGSHRIPCGSRPLMLPKCHACRTNRHNADIQRLADPIWIPCGSRLFLEKPHTE